MRQGQQNRRGRGRNNRKGQSPVNRSFESNGPDVKIRGTPAHIGEKYLSLARDAAASGDPVLAENYLQHAEHYNRIIMAAREQSMGPGDYMNGMGRPRLGQGMDPVEGGDDFGDDEGDDFSEPLAPQRPHEAQQPRLYEGNQRQDDRPFRRPEYGRSPPRERNAGDARGVVGERSRPERPREAADQPGETFAPPARHDAPSRRRERYQPQEQHEQPEFLRRPVRRPRREANGVEAEQDEDRPVTAEDEGGGDRE